MIRLCQQIADARWFHQLVLGVILAAGVLVGLETSPAILARHGALLHALDRLVLGVFVLEIAVKLLGRGREWWRFFTDGWNVFDFIIVAVCLLPFPTQFAAVLRLVRVLRVLRLVTALPRLQILVGALLKSIPSMGYVAVLLLLHFYIYAVLGVSFFRAGDPEAFGNVGRAMLTLFQIVTLEGWVDLMDRQFAAGVLAAPGIVAYFVSFILLGTMIILNLLIGVIMSGMQEAAAEAEATNRARHRHDAGAPSLDDDFRALERQVKGLAEALEQLRRRAARRD